MVTPKAAEEIEYIQGSLEEDKRGIIPRDTRFTGNGKSPDQENTLAQNHAFGGM